MYQMPFPSLPMYWIVPAVRDLNMGDTGSETS
jgi:hypothetical protein